MNGEGDGQSPTPVIAYLRVSTDEQGRSGLGLAAQKRTIEGLLRDDGIPNAPVEWVEEVASGKDLNRDELRGALERLAAGKARALYAAKGDRLSRSELDIATLLVRSVEEGWDLRATDIDPSTSEGRLLTHISAAVGQYEREKIGERTREALAAAKERGVKLGRPPVTHPRAIVNRIRRERDRGASYATIAEELNRDGVGTLKGVGRWHPSSVKRILDRAEEAGDDRR